MGKKLNLIEIIQKWMDTMAGQTFMNYAYSWGAAIVILGTLFKLTHLPGANLMLFIGMGTEVFVFIVAGFERVTEKVPEQAGAGLSSETVEELAAVASAAAQNGGAVVSGGVAGGGTVIIGGGFASAEASQQVTSAKASQQVTSAKASSQDAKASSQDIEASSQDTEASSQNTEGSSQKVVAGGQPIIMGGGIVGGAGLNEAAQLVATNPASVEEAVKNYTEQLSELTEVLGRVKVQAERMSTDSEEMENLNRTLTGIATVYELQLRNISKQVATIEQIDEQTRRMAQQIEELNNVYARMIKALTVNVVGPINPQNEA